MTFDVHFILTLIALICLFCAFIGKPSSQYSLGWLGMFFGLLNTLVR